MWRKGVHGVWSVFPSSVMFQSGSGAFSLCIAVLFPSRSLNWPESAALRHRRLPERGRWVYWCQWKATASLIGRRQTLCPTCPEPPGGPAGSRSLFPTVPSDAAAVGPQLTTGRLLTDKCLRWSQWLLQGRGQTSDQPHSCKRENYKHNSDDHDTK